MPLFATYNAERQRGAWYLVEKMGADGRPRVCGDQVLKHAHIVRNAALVPLAAMAPGQRVAVAWRAAGAEEDSYWEGRLESAPVETMAATRLACKFSGRAVPKQPLATVRVRWLHDSDDSTVLCSQVYESLGGDAVESAWPRGPGFNPEW